MAALNFGEFASAVSPDEPCGPDLEDDLDFMNVMARLEVALPTSYFRRDDEGRQVAFDRSAIDFLSAFADLGRLLAKTRDVRLFVLAGKLSLLNRDLASFAACMGLIADHLANHWDTVHPRPQDGDVIMREIALQSLDDLATVVLPLQHAPLVVGRRIGPLAFRSQLVATGETKLVEGEQHPEVNTIQAALGEVDIAELGAALDHVRTITEALAQISALWSTRTGETLTFPRLATLAAQMLAFLDAAVARRVPGHQAAAPADGETGEPGPAAPAVSGACTSILQVKDALSACLDYFRRVEPSSPAVLLIGQAQQLIGKSLIEVIQIMFPEHVDKAMIAVGQTVRFQLPLERLAASVPQDYDEPQDDDEPQDYDEPQEQDAAEDADEAEARDDPGTDPGVAPVVTRAEAVARMAAVARFYRVVEPSHPTPLLMDKACALAQHDFMSLMGDILPELGNRPDDGS